MTIRVFNIAPTILGLMLATLISACGEMSETDYLARAQEMADSGDATAAIIDYKNVLQINPNNSSARLRLGLLYLDAYDVSEATKELEKAADLGVPPDEVVPSLARAYLLQGQNAQIQAMDTSNLSDQPLSDLLTVKAKANLASGQVDAARVVAESALELNPNNVDAKVVLAWLLALKSSDESQKELNQLVQQHPDNAYAWQILAQLQDRLGQKEEAETAYSRSLELEPIAPQWLSRGLVRIGLGKYDKAQSDIYEARKLVPGWFMVHYAQGVLHHMRGEHDLAKTSLDAVIAVLPSGSSSNPIPQLQATRLYLAGSNFELGNLEQAEHHVTAFLQAAPTFPEALMLQARILLKSGDYEEAEQSLRTITDFDPENLDALALLSDALRGQEKYEAQLEVLDTIIALQPGSAEALRRRGNTLVRLGRPLEAVTAFQQALELSPDDWRSAQDLILSQIGKSDLNELVRTAEDFVYDNPKLPASYNLRAFASLAARDLDAATADFERADELEPGNLVANLNLAELAIKEGDFDQAIGRVENVLKNNPEDLPAQLKLAQIYRLQGDSAAFTQTIDAAAAAHPESLEAQLLLVNNYMATDQAQKAISKLNSLKQAHPDSLHVMDYLTRVHLMRRESDAAIGNMTTVLDAKPDYADGNFLLSQAYAQKNDRKNTRLYLERAIAADSAHMAARIAMAQLAQRFGDSDEARAQLVFLEKLAPEHPDVLMVKARLLDAEGKDDQALGVMEQIFESVSSRDTLLAVAAQEKSMGRDDAVIQRLEKWLQGQPDDIPVMLQLASLREQSGDIQGAVKQYEEVLELGDNAVALNNLAWLYRESKPKEALDYIEKAHELAPNSAVVADTYAVVLFHNKEFREALKFSNQATGDTTAAKGNPGLFYHKAQILHALGQDERALRILNTLLAREQAFENREEAKQLLARLEG